MDRRKLPYLTLTVGAVLGACREPVGPDASALPIESPEQIASALSKWTTKAPMLTRRHSLAAGVITNAAGQTIVYTIGGLPWGGGGFRRVDAYNPVTNTWSRKAPLPEQRFATNGTGTIGGKLYLSGGYNDLGAEEYAPPLKTLFVYDPATNAWSRKADMPIGNVDGVTGVIRGRLYVLTTNCPDCQAPPLVSRLYRYDPATNKWTRLADCPGYHDEAAGGVVNDQFYIVGGHGTQGLARRVDVYNPATNRWHSRASAPTARASMAAAVLNKKLYVVGGFARKNQGVAAVAITEVYDPATNSWSTTAAMPTPRFGLVAVRVTNVAGHGQLHALGGHLSDSLVPNPVIPINEAFTP